MYSPDSSQHTPRWYQLAQHLGVPMTEVADRLIQHGLHNLDTVFEWRPENGDQDVAHAAAAVEVPEEISA